MKDKDFQELIANITICCVERNSIIQCISLSSLYIDNEHHSHVFLVDRLTNSRISSLLSSTFPIDKSMRDKIYEALGEYYIGYKPILVNKLSKHFKKVREVK